MLSFDDTSDNQSWCQTLEALCRSFYYTLQNNRVLHYEAWCFVAEGHASLQKEMLHHWRKCFIVGLVLWISVAVSLKVKHDLQKRSIAYQHEAMLRETTQCFARRSNAPRDETMLRFCTSCQNDARDGFLICSKSANISKIVSKKQKFLLAKPLGGIV